MELRLMNSADESLAEQFLANHRDTSMFLRSNIRRAGLDFRPAPFHAIHVGAICDGRVSGIVAHAWNGMVLVQAPEHADDLARECIKLSARPVTGLTGPLEQVKLVRAALGLMSTPAALESAEWLYGLNLSDLIVPDALSQGVILCRPPRKEETATLHDWRFNYDIETVGASATDETRRRAAHSLDVQIADGNAWVAVENDQPVSLSSFNASLPDIVQLGGIYTPPQFRGRGYAKVAVAGSLIAARERRVSRAVLFTDNPSAARSYERVGFKREGDYGLVLFR
jgi:RimJ/RimL family protein N-acetyltransferase